MFKTDPGALVAVLSWTVVTTHQLEQGDDEKEEIQKDADLH